MSLQNCSASKTSKNSHDVLGTLKALWLLIFKILWIKFALKGGIMADTFFTITNSGKDEIVEKNPDLSAMRSLLLPRRRLLPLLRR